VQCPEQKATCVYLLIMSHMEDAAWGHRASTSGLQTITIRLRYIIGYCTRTVGFIFVLDGERLAGARDKLSQIKCNKKRDVCEVQKFVKCKSY